TQFRDFAFAKTPFTQRLPAAFAALGRRSPQGRRRARKAWRRRGLRHLGKLGIGSAGTAVLMRAGFGPGEHRGEAGIRALEHAAPFVARLLLEHLGEAAPHLGPAS